MTDLQRLFRIGVFCFSALSISLSLHATPATADTSYRVEVDLINIKNDRVPVRVFPPKLEGDTAVYNMPKIVPGTYSISDFGRYINDLHAFDINGEELNVTRLDTNRWAIVPAKKLHYISYWVDDTFDDPNSDIFPPGGTNIEAGKNVVFNAFGFVGYFQGAKKNHFDLQVARPGEFYGETTLNRVFSDSLTDRFSARDYFELHDCPILYCKADTASMMVGPTRISVGIYSPDDKITARDVMDVIGELFPATADYLGGTLPTDKYAVLIYFTSDFGMMHGMGALEHHTSTFAVMPAWPLSTLAQSLKDVVAHEFFHIVTPLNIHSEQIADYDFINPEMSEHLWLYEGTTEYAAHHMQVKQELISLDSFLNTIKQKIAIAATYDTTVAFTELSKKALDEYADQYGNVYMEGALIGMALDLELLHLSGGRYGLRDLMDDMMVKYGRHRPFEDARLFDIIGEVSGYPEATHFLDTHVGHANPLPLKELLGYAGILYAKTKEDTIVSAGNIGTGYNPRTEHMNIASTRDMNEFGKEMGFEYGDEILDWNGRPVTQENFHGVMEAYRNEVSPGEVVKVKVRRKDGNGEYQELELSAPAIMQVVTKKNVLEPMKNPSGEQLAIRKAWIGR